MQTSVADLFSTTIDAVTIIIYTIMTDLHLFDFWHQLLAISAFYSECHDAQWEENSNINGQNLRIEESMAINYASTAG